MSDGVAFLRALGNLLSTGSLYNSGHPSVRLCLHTAVTELSALVEAVDRVAFSFMNDEVIMNEKPLHGMNGWQWSSRLCDAGIQRIEFLASVTERELEGFAFNVARKLDLKQSAFEHAAHPNIQYGRIGMHDVVDAVRVAAAAYADATADGDVSPVALGEESEAIKWIHETAGEKESVPLSETAAVVRGLAIAARNARPLVAPLVELKSTDQYTTVHCINVSILSMSLAEYLEFAHEDVHAIGEAALLHDIGKTRIPVAITNKPGRLTEQERMIIERHPTEGARILLDDRERHEIAAIVAYEHHMHWEGDGGYPKRHYQRKPHVFSRLVQVCDVFDALRTRRPFRPPVSAEAAILFLEDGAGSQFDPNMVTSFVQMMRERNPATVSKEGCVSGSVSDEMGVEDLAVIQSNSFDADTEQSCTDMPETA